jgi:ASC-1-like (ASCH) protein
MPRHILEPVDSETFRLIHFGCKTLEVRVGLGQVRRVKAGDEVAFRCHEADIFEVVRMARYRSFRGMLAVEDHNKIMPGLHKPAVYNHLKDSYTWIGEILLGVYVLELRRAATSTM